MSAVDVAVTPRVRRRRRTLTRLRRRPMAVAGMTVATLFVLVAIFAPLIAPYDPLQTSLTHRLQPPAFAGEVVDEVDALVREAQPGRVVELDQRQLEPVDLLGGNEIVDFDRVRASFTVSSISTYRPWESS